MKQTNNFDVEEVLRKAYLQTYLIILSYLKLRYKTLD